MTDQQRRMVWDLPVRLTHWLLVLAVVGAWLTNKLGPEYFDWHTRCGYAVLVLAVFRICWGFVGTRHARFTSFLRGPRAMWAYLRTSFAPSHDAAMVGHNPMGGIAIVLMLVLLAVQGMTGLFANDEIANTGPLFGWVSGELSNRLTSVHHLVFDALQVMIGLHLAAITFYTVFKRAKLIKPMITGRKEAQYVPPADEIQSSRLPLAIVLYLLLVAALVYAVRSAPEASLSFF